MEEESQLTDLGRFPEPRTDEGKVLLAALAGGDFDEVVRGLEQPSGSPRIIGVAFTTVIQRKFSSSSNLRDLTRYLSDLFGVGDVTPAWLRRAEVLLRLALGNRTMFRPEDSNQDAQIMQSVLFAAVEEMSLSKPEIVALVIDSENLVESSELDVAIEVQTELEQLSVADRAERDRTPFWRRKKPVSRSPGRTDVGGPGPATLLGQMMRARAMRQPEAAAEWLKRISGTKWVDVEEYTDILFATSVSRRFTSEVNIIEIDSLISVMTEFYENDRLKIPPIEMEMLIRRELGESVPIGDIHWKLAMVLKQVMFVAVADDLRYTAAEIDDLLIEVEDIAAQRGYHPTLMD